MRIVCPACAAAYQVPDGRLAPGRVVRCARCDTDWVPLPPVEPEVQMAAPEPEPEPAPEPEPEAVPVNEPAPLLEADAGHRYATSQPAAGWTLRVAWILSIAVVLAGLVGGVVARDGVMQAWPPSIRAYAALGLTRGPAAPASQERPAH